MTATTFSYRWRLEDFLLAWEAGAFGKRVELIDGEVWTVPIGPWHARTTGRAIRSLPNGNVEVLAGSLPAGNSLPEPDCWVLRVGAEPVAQLSPRMLSWATEDVLLVVEVSDETLDHDLSRKARLYADAGYGWYWSITRDGVYAHSEPGPAGYRERRLHARGERVRVPYAEDAALDVSHLIGPPD